MNNKSAIKKEHKGKFFFQDVYNSYKKDFTQHLKKHNLYVETASGEIYQASESDRRLHKLKSAISAGDLRAETAKKLDVLEKLKDLYQTM